MCLYQTHLGSPESSSLGLCWDPHWTGGLQAHRSRHGTITLLFFPSFRVIKHWPHAKCYAGPVGVQKSIALYFDKPSNWVRLLKMMALEDEGREEGSQASLSPLPGSLRPLLTHSCSFGKTESKDDRAVQLYKNCSCTFSAETRASLARN